MLLKAPAFAAAPDLDVRTQGSASDWGPSPYDYAPEAYSAARPVRHAKALWSAAWFCPL